MQDKHSTYLTPLSPPPSAPPPPTALLKGYSPPPPICSILQMETPRFGEVTEVRAKCLSYKVTYTSGYDKDQLNLVACSDIRNLGGFSCNTVETATGQKSTSVGRHPPPRLVTPGLSTEAAGPTLASL